METKTCSDCERTLALSEFYQSSGNVQSRCKPCFNRMCVARWRRIKAEEVERMGGACADCSRSFHPDVFEFHHLDPSIKEYSWTKLRLFSTARRHAELAKCVMLCANCHRMRHVVAEDAVPYIASGRGGGIRTHDLLLPKQARYRAALRPERPRDAAEAPR